MATKYYEFDSTPGTLYADLRTRILSSVEWSDLSQVTPPSTTSTAAMLTGSVTVNAITGFAAGQLVAIGNDTNREYRVLTSVSGTTLSWGGVSVDFAHAAGETVVVASNLFKATAPNGAQIVVDLTDANNATYPRAHRATMAVYRAHDGTTGVDKIQRHFVFRNTLGTQADPLHIVLSVGPGHFYLSIEGPREGEPNPSEALYGSFRQALAVCELVPYHPGGPPAVACIGFLSSTGSVLEQRAFVSRNHADTASWVAARLASLQPVQSAATNSAVSMSLTRRSTADGKDYLWPYVVVEMVDGLRGRLGQFHYAGPATSTVAGDFSAAAGERFLFEGNSYIGVLPSRGTNSISVGPFGFGDNATGSTGRGPIVAVPYGT